MTTFVLLGVLALLTAQDPPPPAEPAIPQTEPATPPSEPAAPQSDPTAAPKKPRKHHRTVPQVQPGGAGKRPVVPPADVERLHAAFETVPDTNAERVARLVDLFKGAGAEAEQVEVVPLGASLMAGAQRQSDALRERLTQAGASTTETANALAALNRRLQALDGNVVAKLPGRSERVVLLTAHLDASPGSAGIIDDWAGCALLTELFAACHGVSFRHELWFVAFAKHEDGCLGSAAFADQLTQEQCDRIDAVFSVELAGAAAPHVWWTGSERGMAEVAADVATETGLALQVVDFAGGNSDGRILKGKNLPVLSLLGLEPARFKLLHGPEDRVEALQIVHLLEMRNLLARLLRTADVAPQPLLWDYVSEKLRIGDEPGMRKALQPVPVDLSAAVAPAPAPAGPTSPRDRSH